MLCFYRPPWVLSAMRNCKIPWKQWLIHSAYTASRTTKPLRILKDMTLQRGHFFNKRFFSQREKFFAELDSVADVAPNIEDFVKMVEKENSREKISNASVKKNRKAYVSTAEQIRTGLAHVDVTFSRIFQALLVLIDNPTSSSNSARAGSPEKERVSRRSREFNVRLKRIAFELKQKVLHLRFLRTQMFNELRYSCLNSSGGANQVRSDEAEDSPGKCQVTRGNRN